MCLSHRRTGLLVAIVLAAGCAAEPTTLLVTVTKPTGAAIRRLTAEVTVGGVAAAPAVRDRPALPGTFVVQLVTAARQVDVAVTAEDENGLTLAAEASVESKPYQQVPLTLALAYLPAGDMAVPDAGATDLAADLAADLAPPDLMPAPCGKVADVLADNYTDGTRAPAWTSFANAGTTIAETGGRLQLTLAASSPSAYLAYYTRRRYDLRDSRLFVEVPQVAATGTTAQAYLQARLDPNNDVEVLEEGGRIYARKEIGGTIMSIASVTYDATLHRWWQIREAAGTTYWETSANGTTWTELASQANPIPLDAIEVQTGAGTYQSVVAPGAVHYDNLNGGGTPTGLFCPIAGHKDDFNDGTSTDRKWLGNYSTGGCVASESGGGALLSPAVSVVSECGFISSTLYDLTDSSLTVEVPALGTAPALYAFFEVFGLGGTNKLTIVEQNGILSFEQTLNSVATTHATVTYVPATHRWWRIREQAGTTYWETATDGKTWTIRVQRPTPFPPRAVAIGFGAGTSSGVLVPGTARFDNVNLPPP